MSSTISKCFRKFAATTEATAATVGDAVGQRHMAFCYTHTRGGGGGGDGGGETGGGGDGSGGGCGG